jgi:hypothetical protein
VEADSCNDKTVLAIDDIQQDGPCIGSANVDREDGLSLNYGWRHRFCFPVPRVTMLAELRSLIL